MVAAVAGWAQALTRNVRANPAYRLWPLGSLPEDHRRSLRGLGVDPSTVFGVLVAGPDCGLPDKVVDEAGAELFSALRQPGPVPPAAADRLAELVLDGVLEIESSSGYVSGPVAFEALVTPAAAAPAPPPDRLCRLSHAGLCYAERLRLTDVAQVTARLYSYHRVPLSHRWARAYPDPAAVMDLVRRPTLTRHWVGRENGEYWLSWARRDGRLAAGPDAFGYKLYVSPDVEELPAVLPALVDALSATSASRFKIGADAPGFLRPDKIVIYLADVDELATVARAVAAALDGVRAHGVPFSAELAGDGLLSWGGDPPPGSGPLGGGNESWRLSVCRRMAEYLVAAHAAELRHTDPVDFVLARLALDGVDVRSFAPAGLDPPARAEHRPVRRP